MIYAANQELPWRLLLKVTLQTQRLIARFQHLLIHRSMRIVARDASLSHRFVFENERALLRDVTLETGVIHRG